MDEETGMMRQKLLKIKLPTDATTGAKPFLVRDFLICKSLIFSISTRIRTVK